jgi:hypothetical protein
LGSLFGSFSPRGARSKGDQQPDGRVAHNQKPQNILRVNTGTLATRVLRAKKTRKSKLQCFAAQPNLVSFNRNRPPAYSLLTVCKAVPDFDELSIEADTCRKRRRRGLQKGLGSCW